MGGGTRGGAHQSNITVSPENEFSRKDLTTECRIAAQENGCRMRRELHTIISICPPVPSLPTLLHPSPPPGTGPSPQAPHGSLGEAAWAMRSFPTRLPPVVGHPPPNLPNRALRSREKQPRLCSHPSVFSSVPRQLLALGWLNLR